MSFLSRNGMRESAFISRKNFFSFMESIIRVIIKKSRFLC